MNSKTLELTPDRWARVESLFDRAVQLPPDRREQFLADSCSDDNELCAYVISLLQIDGAGANDLENTIVDALQSAISSAVERKEEMQGALLGPYRIVSTLGSGGMGVVYLAERADEQYQQQVAIKLGRHRLVDHSAEQRLRDERQILANLDHPNIARLLDGGTADDGTPYIVMEYIDGVRIDTYCDRNRLGVDARLELFHTICSSIHYAHQNLVVHRDIKPSNILVTDEGVPKLLDFGIAKLVDAQGTATDGLTREGTVMMTPENAAPEQVLGNPITTATDTYALGLLLYSLLTGMPAYSLKDKPAAEMARIICQQKPEAPSVRIARLIARARQQKCEIEIERAERIGQDRGSSTDRLARRLRGDIDTIVLNALRKEPERRYRSVNQFAEDIRLYRESLPIVARADSWNYRAGKFVRRHYAGVATSGLVVSLLVAFAVVTTIQNQRIAAERDLAREVSTFLEQIFESPDPQRARGAEVTAKEILDAGAERIYRELAEQPEVRSTLMATMGRVYMNLGDYEPSAEMLEGSLKERRKMYGDRHESVAESKNELARTLTMQADYARAESLLEEALEFNRSQLNTDPLPVAANLFNLAEVYLNTGKLDEAVKFARDSITIFSDFEESNAIDLANAKSLLARSYQMKGDLVATETHLREAIDIVRRYGGPDHPLMAYYLQNLGALLQSKGEIDAAEDTLEQAIDVTRRVLGEKHDHLATTLVNQANLLHDKGKFEEAEIALRGALEIDKESWGNEHPNIGYDMTSLGMLLHDKGDFVAAEKALREALRIYGLSLAEDHQYVASTLTQLGAVLNASDRAEEANDLLQRASSIRRKDFPADHPLVAATNVEYGNTLISLERFAEAEALLLASHEVLRDQANRRSRRARDAVVRLYTAWGKPEQAAEYRPPD